MPEKYLFMQTYSDPRWYSVGGFACKLQTILCIWKSSTCIELKQKVWTELKLFFKGIYSQFLKFLIADI